jgi:capsular polysaccharide transport system permease protein
MSDENDNAGDEQRFAIVRQPRFPKKKDRAERAKRFDVEPIRRVETPAPSRPKPVTAASWAAAAVDVDWVANSRRRSRNFALRLLLFVALPTAIVAAYMFYYATPRYVSEFLITYQSATNSSSLTSGGGGALSSILGSNSSIDISGIISTYVTSSAALSAVEEKMDFRKYYSDPKIDYLSRLSPTASREQLLRYYLWRVTSNEQMGGYVTVDAQAFDPKTAQEIAQALAAACDKMVTGMTQRQRDDYVKFAEKQLATMESRLDEATLNVINFRNQHRDFNPQTAATQLDTVIGGLEQQLSVARSDLTNASNFLGPTAPTVVALKAKIDALTQQIKLEQSRLSNPATAASGGEQPFSQLVAEYVRVTQAQQYATESYTSAKQVLDAANAAAAQQQQYAVTFVPPNLPETASWSDGVKYTLSTFLIALFLYFLGSLVFGAFRESAGA